MPRLSRRRWLFLFLILAAIPAAILFEKWREGGRRGGQTAAEPFRIAGNLYYVGASDITSFLITGNVNVVQPRVCPGVMCAVISVVPKRIFSPSLNVRATRPF